MKKHFYAFLLFLLAASTSYAQLTSCTQTLRLARSTYEQGRLHEIPNLFEKCLVSGFSQEEKVEAYKLLCLTYIYLEEPQKADEAMLNLLKTNHYFEVNRDDPAEFIALYRTFRTDPIYRLGGKMGVNASQPNVVSYIPANDGKSEYSYGLSFQAGFAAEIPLKKNLVFVPELNLLLRNFKYENISNYIEASTQETRQFTTTSTERQAWVSIPLSVQYVYTKSRFNPFGSLGVSTDLLLSANNTFLRTKQESSSLEEQNIDMKTDRAKINISAIVSAGGKLKVSGGYAIAELRYTHGLTNINGKENIYSRFDKTFPTGGFVDGIFKLNSLSFTVGYVYNIFNPKKLKK